MSGSTVVFLTLIILRHRKESKLRFHAADDVIILLTSVEKVNCEYAFITCKVSDRLRVTTERAIGSVVCVVNARADSAVKKILSFNDSILDLLVANYVVAVGSIRLFGEVFKIPSIG